MYDDDENDAEDVEYILHCIRAVAGCSIARQQMQTKLHRVAITLVENGVKDNMRSLSCTQECIYLEQNEEWESGSTSYSDYAEDAAAIRVMSVYLCTVNCTALDD